MVTLKKTEQDLDFQFFARLFAFTYYYTIVRILIVS